MAPLFSEVLFSTSLPLAARLPLAFGSSLIIGFALPLIAKQLGRAHEGFTLYNMGFTAGLLGTVVVAIYKAYGFIPDPLVASVLVPVIIAWRHRESKDFRATLSEDYESP